MHRHGEDKALDRRTGPSTYTNRGHLKKRLLGEGLLENTCAICGISEWLGAPIVLVLDHINGVNTGHRLQNLRMLCPNCNAQQDTFAGRNQGRRNRARDSQS